MFEVRAGSQAQAKSYQYEVRVTNRAGQEKAVKTCFIWEIALDVLESFLKTGEYKSGRIWKVI